MVFASSAQAYRRGFDVARQGASVTFAVCPDSGEAFGCYHPISWGYSPELSGRIFVAAPDHEALAHEFGHRADDLFFDGVERHRFMLAARIPLSRPWSMTKDPPTAPNEQLADAFANCAMGYGLPGRRLNRWFSSSGYNPPNDAAHARVCRIIRSALRDRSDVPMPFPR